MDEAEKSTQRALDMARGYMDEVEMGVTQGKVGKDKRSDLSLSTGGVSGSTKEGLKKGMGMTTKKTSAGGVFRL